jgi:hypothetical protein
MKQPYSVYYTVYAFLFLLLSPHTPITDILYSMDKLGAALKDTEHYSLPPEVVAALRDSDTGEL